VVRALVPIVLLLAPAAHAQSRLWTVDGDGPLDLLGWSVGALGGDVTGDQVPDVIVGAWQAGAGSGYARVHSGADGALVLQTFGAFPGGRYGWSVSGAPDRDGDQRRELLIGAPRADWGATDAGSVYVVSSATGLVLARLDGDDAGDELGFSVADAGDVDGDGTSDYVVGAPFDDDGGVDAGSARVHSGADDTLIWRWDGAASGDRLGWSVSGAGDVDGDGFDDVIAGARQDSARPGYAVVWSGRHGGILFSVQGDDPGDEFGSSVARAGLVDGDALADVVVGAPGDDPNLLGLRAGTVSVYSGAGGGLLHRLAGANDDAFGTSVTGLGDVTGDGRDDFASGARHDHLDYHTGRVEAYSGLDGALLFTVLGDHDDNFFGSAVSGVGDVDGDGRGDVLVGAFREDGSADDAGRAVLFSSACRAPATYCSGAPNSVGAGASIGWSGTYAHASNGLVLEASGAPPGQFGVFIYGRSADLAPFGDGWLCLQAQPVGLFRLLPPVAIDAAGAAQHALDLGARPAHAGSGLIAPGSSWNFQFWYRDPGAGGTGFNASDALAVTFCG
jgi:hypothetical protein